MRLSLGQEMQLVQKQVLAPRMIQSMEILQLPIMALQERIEQEMEENPVPRPGRAGPGRDRRGGRGRGRPECRLAWPTPSASWSSKTAPTTRTTSSGC